MKTLEEGTMEEKQGYNGWTNYETWCMALWIDNDQGSYNESREMARNVREWAEGLDVAQRAPFTADEKARYELAERLSTWMDDARPELGASVWSDLLTASFQSVNWSEIAENYLQEVAAEEE